MEVEPVNLSIRPFTTHDGELENIIGLISNATKEATKPVGPLRDGCIGLRIQDALAPLGVRLSFEECGVRFPSDIAVACRHWGGQVDFSARYKGKTIGIEDEPSGWYRACVPEILKLGWSSFDIRVCAWGIRLRSALERFKTIEMLPFPNTVIVVTKFGVLEVSSDYSHRA